MADHSSTLKAQSEDKKTINILNQTNGKKKLGMDNTSGGEVASMRGSDLVNIVGQRIKERLTSLIYFGSTNILKVKANSCDCLFEGMREMRRGHAHLDPLHQVE